MQDIVESDQIITADEEKLIARFKQDGQTLLAEIATTRTAEESN
jgi:hypothetical protein